MVTLKKIKGLDFNNINEYFDYIIESKINGNFSQFKNLIKDLSKDQRRDFKNYLDFSFESGSELKEEIVDAMI